jgi:hypothetical protein
LFISIKLNPTNSILKRNQELQSTLFETKKPSKSSLNSTQCELVFELASRLPLDFLDTKHGLVFFFLCERMATTDHRKIDIYVRLSSSTALLELMPLAAVQHWLTSLLKFFENSQRWVIEQLAIEN